MLGSWTFVTSIIGVRFMVDQHPFLLEALTWVNNNTFIFQQHIFFPTTPKGTMWSFTNPNTSGFFLLNNSLDNKWFNFKIPFWSVYIIIHFLTCFPTWYQRLIMLEFYHVLALERHLAYTLIGIFILSIIFPNFFHITLNTAWIITSFNCRPTLMCVYTSHQPYGYSPFTLHPWQWVHKNPWWSSWHFLSQP